MYSLVQVVQHRYSRPHAGSSVRAGTDAEIKRAKKSEKSSQYKLYAKCVEHQAEYQVCEKMCETESVQMLRKMRRASSGRSSAIAKFSSLPHHLQACRTVREDTHNFDSMAHGSYLGNARVQTLKFIGRLIYIC